MFRKTDLILIVSIIIAAFVLTLLVYLIPFEGEPIVSVYIDGQRIQSYTFDEEEYQEISIDTMYGSNTLVISDNMAFISESDCQTGSCVSARVISRPGSMIICAPNHLVIKIETAEDTGDAQ